MNENDIVVGKCYEAKRPALCGNIFESYVNDRQVIWISSDKSLVQYDSPSVKNGRNYPKVSMEKFLNWAARDVTAEIPKGEWRTSFKKDAA